MQKRIDELEARFNMKIHSINEVIEILLTQPEEKSQKTKTHKVVGFKVPKNK